ncbi:hypothetical protein GGH13_001148, partial [Coemansia sp. S155-1]
MTQTFCIIERSVESNEIDLCLVWGESGNANIDENTKYGIASYMDCLGARFTRAEVQKLH